MFNKIMNGLALALGWTLGLLVIYLIRLVPAIILILLAILCFNSCI